VIYILTEVYLAHGPEGWEVQDQEVSSCEALNSVSAGQRPESMQTGNEGQRELSD
jgi:hypothetical protein